MNPQLSAVIIDADPTNRQELAKFLTSFGVTLAAQYPTLDSLIPILSRSDAPHVDYLSPAAALASNTFCVGTYLATNFRRNSANVPSPMAARASSITFTNMRVL